MTRQQIRFNFKPKDVHISLSDAAMFACILYMSTKVTPSEQKREWPLPQTSLAWDVDLARPRRQQGQQRATAALAEADERAAVAEQEAAAAAWAARRMKRRVRKRAEKGGWKLDRSGSGFTQLGADGAPEAEGAERGKVQQQTSLFFDAVAAQVL